MTPPPQPGSDSPERKTENKAEVRRSDPFRMMANHLKNIRPYLQKTPADGVGWRVQLTMVDDSSRQKTVSIDTDAVLGAYPPGDPRVDISLTDWQAVERGVSRRHAVLRVKDNHLLLIDLGSTNGTFLNTVPVTSGWARPVSDGDLLSLGDLDLWLHILEHPKK
jgi:hypothetical protein